MIHFYLFYGILGHDTTLVAFIDYLVSSGQPLSKTIPFILKFPVERSHYQLDHCQITLGQTIGNVSFFPVSENTVYM